MKVIMILHATSILERLSAPLCDALMEQADSQQVLEYLERANLFVVSLDTVRRWIWPYRGFNSVSSLDMSCISRM